MRVTPVIVLLAGLLAPRWAAGQFANTDPNYRILRDSLPAETYRVENIELKRDVGTLTLRTGQLTFLPPVLKHVSMAVFNGEGRFNLKPAIPIEERHLNLLFGRPEVDEPFDSALLCFTDATLEEVRGQARTMALDPRAADTLKEFRRRLRGVAMSNVEADLLGELYNAPQGGSFRAFLHGKQNSDLRFLVVPGGALPDMPSPEEVALVNVDQSGERSGEWYLSHLESEWKSGTASSNEDRHVAAAKHYHIETAIANGGQLTAAADIEMTAKIDGARVIPVGLLPTLRVTRVTGERGQELNYIQEAVKEDPLFYVILPEPAVRGQSYQIHVEYTGGQVIRNEGQGNFSVGARESWYPSLNSFLDRATYDLVFKIPKQYTLVSVGKLVKDWQEGNQACSEWISEIPLAVAGFNFGAFKKKVLMDRESKYEIETYTIQEVPDSLRAFAAQFSLTPSAMADRALVEGENSIRLFQHWFGDAPYGRIAITEQPQFNFGQSWPSLVYLPISAFLDSTQRWTLMGSEAFRFQDFIQEVTPHEIAHQWWGHMVGFATYHDLWLSEGFAEFSAGLFVEATSKPSAVDTFWDRLRDEIVQKNNFGIAPNDAGPLWLGERLNTFKTPGAYNRLVYPKGAYILQMLRMLMYDPMTGDQDFIAMMHDYVHTFLNQNASTEGFKAVVEKHMKPAMDAEGNQRMDWFFRNFVYGTALPKYRLEYTLTPSGGGKAVFEAKLTQSGVPADFIMRVPLYFDLDGHWLASGRVNVRGDMTAHVKAKLPKMPKRVSINVHRDLLAAEIVVKKL